MKPDERGADGDYEPTPAELAGIDRGLRDAAAGRFANEPQVEAALTRLRGAPCHHPAYPGDPA